MVLLEVMVVMMMAAFVRPPGTIGPAPGLPHMVPYQSRFYAHIPRLRCIRDESEKKIVLLCIVIRTLNTDGNQLLTVYYE